MRSTTSAERQAASVEALRQAGGKRISVSLPKASVRVVEQVMRKMQFQSQTEALIYCISLAKPTKAKP